MHNSPLRRHIALTRNRHRPGQFGRCLFVLVVVMLFTTTTGVRPSLADDGGLTGEVVTDSQTSHQIEFGTAIHVQLSATVNGNVSAVRAIFAPEGTRRVSSYSYPEFTVSPEGTELDAEFSIRTGGTAYVPPGTVFEVHFELTSSNGTVSSTSPVRILYMDPRRDWQVISRPGIPVEFHYYGFSPSLAGSLADRVESTWPGIADAIGLDTETLPRFTAVIYPDFRDMNAVFPPTSSAATDGVFFGGFAMQRYGVFVLGGPHADSVVHELTHLLVDSRVTSPLSPGVPSWLHEGLAQFFEEGASSPYTDRLSDAASDNRLLTLRNRNTVPSLEDEIPLFYTQVGSFVGELIERYGPQPMSDTLGLINHGHTASEAIERAYGIPLWQLENEWRERLGASKLPAPSPSESPVSEPTVTDTVPPTRQTTAQQTPVPVGETPHPDPEPWKFNWTGPLVGAAAACIVFAIWSFRVNRRRMRAHRK